MVLEGFFPLRHVGGLLGIPPSIRGLGKIGKYITSQPARMTAAMSSDFECLFRKEISFKNWETENVAKCVTVNRKRGDGRIFLQVRLFVRANLVPTSTGVSLSSRQTRMLMELAENVIKMEEPNTWDEHLAPEGMHNLTGDGWIGITKGGKEILLMRKNSDGVKGVSLTVDEYSRLRQYFGAIGHLMFPTPAPKDVEIIESLGYELKRILNVIRYEDCRGCEMELGNQLGHDCVMMNDETMIMRYFHKAVKGVNMPRVMVHVEYLHDLLKCANPIPTTEDVKNYLGDYAWLVKHIQKESSIEALLSSFSELHE